MSGHVGADAADAGSSVATWRSAARAWARSRSLIGGVTAIAGGAFALASPFVVWRKLYFGAGTRTETGWESRIEAKAMLVFGVFAIANGIDQLTRRDRRLRLVAVAAGLGAVAVFWRVVLGGPTVEIAAGALGGDAGLGVWLVLTSAALLIGGGVLSLLMERDNREGAD